MTRMRPRSHFVEESDAVESDNVNSPVKNPWKDDKKKNGGVIIIFFVLSIFNFVGLILDNALVMHNADKFQNTLSDLSENVIQEKQNINMAADTLELKISGIQNSIMSSCFKGGSTH